MPNLCCITIFAGRVTLKPVSSAYEADIFREFTDEVARYTVPQPGADIGATRAFVARSREEMERGTGLTVAVLERETGAFLGCASLHGTDTPMPEVGLWIAVGAQGRGYGCEAISALIAWADANLRYDHIVYPVARENAPSIRLVESLGGIRTGERGVENACGRKLDEFVYHIPKAVPVG